MVSFSLAANSGFGDQKTTTWYRVSFWGKQGEVIAKNVTKGEQLIVNGTLNVREYEKNGTKAYSLDVRGSTFDFCGSKKQTKDETEDAGF